MTAGPARTPNRRQDELNAEFRSALYDDNILDVYVDVDGIMRGKAGKFMNEYNVQTIKAGLTYFHDNITGIPIRFVDTEDKSELSIHKIDPAPASGFERWGFSSAVKGMVHSKGGQDLNLYFEGGNGSLERTNHVIYHEMAHIFGAYELARPFDYDSSQTVMGYQFNGFHGFTASDDAFFNSIY